MCFGDKLMPRRLLLRWQVQATVVSDRIAATWLPGHDVGAKSYRAHLPLPSDFGRYTVCV